MASEETDIRERVDVAEGDEPVASGEDTAEVAEVKPVLSLKQRMAAIRDECAGIGKEDISMETKSGSKFKIKGHTFEAVLSEIRPLFAKHGVDMTPNLVEREYVGNRCDVLVDFTFERTDDIDEQRVIRWAGAGTDNGDKAFAKAGTNAVKEMLKKRFLVTDRDDAKEETESVEHQTEDGLNRAAIDQERERSRKAVQTWAAAFKAAVEGASDLESLKRIERDNRQQLSDEALPDVTRSFFIDLIEKRKRDLAS